MRTAFFHDERCFWHGGGNYALTLPVGGFVQPGGGLPENPETKRRLVNLLRVSGLMAEIDAGSGAEASREDLLRVHPVSYLDAFKAASDAGGGELGLRTPFGPGGYEIAALSAGLTKAATFAVLEGRARNAYALSRPPGHHCLPDWPNGFCLMNNIAVAIRAAQAAGLARRFAVVDWDVHHGNGTEAVFLDDPEVLTISLHQEWNYPLDTGSARVRGAEGSNINIPLPPGTGEESYLEAWDRIVAPALARHRPEAMHAAETLCHDRLILTHEGGYSEVHVPFCGHAVLEELSGSTIRVPDPLGDTIGARQPTMRWIDETSRYLADLAREFAL